MYFSLKKKNRCLLRWGCVLGFFLWEEQRPRELMILFVLAFLVCVSGQQRTSFRLFASTVIDEFVANVSARLSDRHLASIFEIAFPNALDATVHFNEEAGTTFVVTGDIAAQWIRDSTNQVMPYVPFINRDVKVKAMFKGLIKTQVGELTVDPFANAFTGWLLNFFFFVVPALSSVVLFFVL
jgi:hypothetical protein